jgi:hypothetical protein
VEIGLQLLMRDGAICLTFRPRLTAEQYDELMAMTEKATTRAELCFFVERAVERWQIECQVEDVV